MPPRRCRPRPGTAGSRAVAPQLLTQPVRQPNAFPRHVLGQPRPLAQSTTAASVGSSRRKHWASVRNAEASTRASRRPSLAPARRQPVAEAVQLLRVNRVDREAAFHQALDHRPARRLDRHAHLRRAPGERQHPVRHLRQTRATVLESPFREDLPGRVDDARLVRPRAAVDAASHASSISTSLRCQVPRPHGHQRCRPFPVLALSGATPHRAHIDGRLLGHESEGGARGTG